MINWRVLVVEDDVDGQEVVGHILRHYNIAADIVSTGEEALDRLAADKYSLAIIDLALPQIDGWTLLASIKSNPAIAELPCIAVTAFHSAEVAVKAIDAGFKAYFPKPLDVGSFIRELQGALA